MYIDFKITTWERITVSDNLSIEVLDGLRDGSITTGNDIFNLDIVLSEDANVSVSMETIPDVEQYISPEENGGKCTIEAVSDGKTIYNNETTL